MKRSRETDQIPTKGQAKPSQRKYGHTGDIPPHTQPNLAQNPTQTPQSQIEPLKSKEKTPDKLG